MRSFCLLVLSLYRSSESGKVYVSEFVAHRKSTPGAGTIRMTLVSFPSYTTTSQSLLHVAKCTTVSGTISTYCLLLPPAQCRIWLHIAKCTTFSGTMKTRYRRSSLLLAYCLSQFPYMASDIKPDLYALVLERSSISLRRKVSKKISRKIHFPLFTFLSPLSHK